MKKKHEKQEKSTEPDPKDETIKELTDTLQRLQAEFENYKKRQDKENKNYVEYAEEKLLTKILPVMDSFEISLKNTSDPEKFKKGVELIFAQLSSVLKESGLKKIEAQGQFDPYLHEVLMTEKGEEEGKILEELQIGYKLKDKVIRHTKVKVSKP